MGGLLLKLFLFYMFSIQYNAKKCAAVCVQSISIVCTDIETKANIGLVFSKVVGGKCNERYIAQQHNNNYQWINFSKYMYLYSMFRKI